MGQGLSDASTSAFAHVCTNANKKEGTGSSGTYNIITESFGPSGETNDDFVTSTYSENSCGVFMHQTLPEGALAAWPGGDNQCDRQGIDNFLICIGFSGSHK